MPYFIDFFYNNDEPEIVIEPQKLTNKRTALSQILKEIDAKETVDEKIAAAKDLLKLLETEKGFI